MLQDMGKLSPGAQHAPPQRQQQQQQQRLPRLFPTSLITTAPSSVTTARAFDVAIAAVRAGVVSCPAKR